MDDQSHIVIIGATSAIAEHCARLWAARGPAHFILVGRSRERLERVAQDLAVRSPASTIRVFEANMVDAQAITDTIAGIEAEGAVDTVLIAHGVLPDQAQGQDDLLATSQSLTINAISPVLYAEGFARAMLARNRGRIAVIGSVAGDRGRKSNYIYGAAKGLISRYVEGMQHRLAGSGVKVVLIKPGPTDTPMAAQHKANGVKLAPVEQVARQIVAAIEAGRPVLYTPHRWLLIMLVVRLMPRWVFNKINI